MADPDQWKKERIAREPNFQIRSSKIEVLVDQFIDYMFCNANGLNENEDERHMLIYENMLQPTEFFYQFQKRLVDEMTLAVAIKTGSLELVLIECMNYSEDDAHNVAASYAMYLSAPVLAQLGDDWFPTPGQALRRHANFGLLPDRAGIAYLKRVIPHAMWQIPWRETNDHHHDVVFWWILLSAIDQGLFRVIAPSRSLEFLLPLPPHLRYQILRYKFQKRMGRCHGVGFGDILTRNDGTFQPGYLRRAIAEVFGITQEMRPYQTEKYILADYLTGDRSRGLKFEILCRAKTDPTWSDDMRENADLLYQQLYNHLDPFYNRYGDVLESFIESLHEEDQLDLLNEFRARFVDPADLTVALKAYMYHHLLRLVLELDDDDSHARVLQRALTVPDSHRELINNDHGDTHATPLCLEEWNDFLPDRRNLKLFLKKWRFGHDAIRGAFTPEMHAYFDAIALFVIVLQIEEGYFNLIPQVTNLARFSRIVQALPEELQVRVCIAAYPNMGQYRAEVVHCYRFKPEYVARAMKEVFEITETSTDYRRVRASIEPHDPHLVGTLANIDAMLVDGWGLNPLAVPAVNNNNDAWAF